MFGDVRSGGLVAEAAAGTLFLDEVCSLSFNAQSTLLRLIQHGTYRSVGSSQEVTLHIQVPLEVRMPYLVDAFLLKKLKQHQVARNFTMISFGFFQS